MLRAAANAQFAGMFQIFPLPPQPFRFATIDGRLKLVGRAACPRASEVADFSRRFIRCRNELNPCPPKGHHIFLRDALRNGAASILFCSGRWRGKTGIAARSFRYARQNLFIRYRWSHRRRAAPAKGATGPSTWLFARSGSPVVENLLH